MLHLSFQKMGILTHVHLFGSDDADYEFYLKRIFYPKCYTEIMSAPNLAEAA